MLRKRRIGNPWNAFTRTKLAAANKGMIESRNESLCYLLYFQLELPIGDKFNMTQFMHEHGDKVRELYNQTCNDEKEALVAEVEQLRQERAKLQRTKPRAMLRDVDATFESLQHEVFYFVYMITRYKCLTDISHSGKAS